MAWSLEAPKTPLQQGGPEQISNLAHALLAPDINNDWLEDN